MDALTEQLLAACQMILFKCQVPTSTNPVEWRFEAGSEAHLVLLEAVDHAQLALGLIPRQPQPVDHAVCVVV